MSANTVTAFEAAVAALTRDELVKIVQLAALTEESFDHQATSSVSHESDVEDTYDRAISRHPNPDDTRATLMRLTELLPSLD